MTVRREEQDWKSSLINAHRKTRMMALTGNAQELERYMDEVGRWTADPPSFARDHKTLIDLYGAMALELGYSTAAGADNVAALARILGMDKQTVNKCAAVFQTKLGLPPRPGQRDETARANMTEARKNQLEK